MSDIEFCPECEAPVIGFGDDIRCTSCGLTYREMVDLIDDDFLDGLGGDDVIETDEMDDMGDNDHASDIGDSGSGGDGNSDNW
jgi:hypothetical protein